LSMLFLWFLVMVPFALFLLFAAITISPIGMAILFTLMVLIWPRRRRNE
jgi:hypothetical protein